MARNAQWTQLAAVSLSLSGYQGAKAALAGITGGLEQAGVAAVNKMAAKTKTRVSAGLTKFLNIKKSNLKRRLFVTKATRAKPVATIRIMGRPIGLINFNAKDTNVKGVIATVVRGEAPIVLPHAFIATGKFGNTHVFQREGPSRLPIDTQFSQRLYDLFKRSPVPADLAVFVPNDLQTQMRGQVQRILARARP